MVLSCCLRAVLGLGKENEALAEYDNGHGVMLRLRHGLVLLYVCSRGTLPGADDLRGALSDSRRNKDFPVIYH